MHTAQEKCPIDSGRLVLLGSEAEPDVSYQYCPRCDIALVAVGGNQAGILPHVFVWRRKGKDLVFDERVADGREGQLKDRKTHESRLRKAVQRFIDHRLGDDAACREDGRSIRVIGQKKDKRQNWIRFAWCDACQLGYGEIADPDYGWDWVVTFTSKDYKPFIVIDARDRKVDVASIETYLQSLDPRSILG